MSERICVGFVGTCEKYYIDESGIPMYRTGNLNGLSLNETDMKFVTRDFHDKNMKSQIFYGDLLIVRHGDNGKAVMYDKTMPANTLNIVIIRPDKSKSNSVFLKNLINSHSVSENIKSLSAGSTQAVINTKEIEKLDVILSRNIEEQRKIGICFDNIDNLINLHQQKYDKLQALKKAYLYEMFPQEVEKIPKKDLRDLVENGNG